MDRPVLYEKVYPYAVFDKRAFKVAIDEMREGLALMGVCDYALPEVSWDDDHVYIRAHDIRTKCSMCNGTGEGPPMYGIPFSGWLKEDGIWSCWYCGGDGTAESEREFLKQLREGT